MPSLGWILLFSVNPFSTDNYVVKLNLTHRRSVYGRRKDD